ncbi:MAG: ATPase domain-containing protein [Ignisphaera sp.]
MYALEGKKCLYISFYEDKEKLFMNMRRLGMNLREVEDRGTMTYIKLPVTSTEELLNAIAEPSIRDAYAVVVIDSINIVLKLVEKKSNKELSF